MNVGVSQGVAVCEFQTDSGPVDYALFIDRRLRGVIEAKAEGVTLSAFSEQAEPISRALRPICGARRVRSASNMSPRRGKSCSGTMPMPNPSRVAPSRFIGPNPDRSLRLSHRRAGAASRRDHGHHQRERIPARAGLASRGLGGVSLERKTAGGVAAELLQASLTATSRRSPRLATAAHGAALRAQATRACQQILLAIGVTPFCRIADWRRVDLRWPRVTVTKGR